MALNPGALSWLGALDPSPRTCRAMVCISCTFFAVLGHSSPNALRHPIVMRTWSLAMASSVPLNKKLHAESSAKVPSLTMQVVNGVWWNCSVGNAKRRICASTDFRTRTVCTLMSSGMGVSRGGVGAQLEIHSTGLNLRSDNGLWRPMIALGNKDEPLPMALYDSKM